MESIENIPSPDFIGNVFNESETSDFLDYLRDLHRKYPSQKIKIIANWVSVDKARAAKGIMENHAPRYNIDSFIIRATDEQQQEEINVFQSGLVTWERI